MDWFYAINNRRFGPVSEERLEELRRSGEVHEDSLVWRAGFGDWRSVRDAFPAVSGGSGTDRMCTECRKYFPQSEMIYLSRAWVCGECKPVFLQRIAEGIAPPLGVGELWRKDRLLIFNAETAFPDRCIHCNAPAKGYRRKCHLQWAPTGRIVLSPRRAMIHVGLCELHRKRRRQILTICGFAILAGVATTILGGALQAGPVVAVGPVLVLSGLLTLAHTASNLAATKIADGTIWLRGAGKPFLADLPEWPGGR